MFSGIVETTSRVLSAKGDAHLIRIVIQRPPQFNDLGIGDSVAVNGVCLTLESANSNEMQFALGPETLKITGWTASSVMQRAVNLERSLRLNDRIHGHLVTGHVDGMGKVTALDRKEELLTVDVTFPSHLAPLIWKKGSVTLNGVSLTVNSVTGTKGTDGVLQVGLIPETLRQTNLESLELGDLITLEVDNLARGLLRSLELK